ncbi:MAG: hypothetical protein N2323_07515 [candidate division WOR-3 bacterium]|nr:hypothetical protein [candidate division WOR-3 bacterium]MCX7837772.1 hypothetical protein [candidate division WOR-3 bacterium]MDW8114019.1 hypothetical protein [candidate division WOR-3 bacterium]
MKRRKGLTFQNWIKKFLEDRGYLVHNQRAGGRLVRNKKGSFYVNLNKDIFGVFDLIAIKKNKKIRWIQATCDSSLKRKIEKIKKIPLSRRFNSLEIWQKKKWGVRVILIDRKPKEIMKIMKGRIIYVNSFSV